MKKWEVHPRLTKLLEAEKRISQKNQPPPAAKQISLTLITIIKFLIIVKITLMKYKL
jgi:hypothetical protein